jgi:hypothetical protein
MTKRRSKPKLPKKPKYELVSTDSQEGKEVRKLVNETVKAHHDHLRNAKIAIAWMVGQKKDKDGRLVLGRMKKASELDRELHEHDLVLLLNREMWKVFGEKQRTALVDHELCHADEALDPNGEAIEDAHGRKQYRIRKHDLEEFAAVVRRHGLWKADLETFATAMDQGRQANLFKKDGAAAAAEPKPTTLPKGKAARPSATA